MTTARTAAATALASAGATHSTTNAHSIAEDDDDEVEQRRREYLRRHREMLLQQQRLETERRLQEHERDRSAIHQRLDDIRAAKQHEQAAVAQQKAHTLRLVPSPSKKQQQPTSAASTASIRLPGIYTRVDDLSPDALRAVADQFALLQDAAPLHTGGKYHSQFIRDRFPIAGTQLKLEKERELIVAAKKKLLLGPSSAPTRAGLRDASIDASANTVAPSSSAASSPLMHKSLSLGSDVMRPYRKFDFVMDKMTRVLTAEEKLVERAHAERHVRFVDVQHAVGLQQFWTLFHTGVMRDVVGWLKMHTFVDVNVPIRLIVTGNSSNSTYSSSVSTSQQPTVQVVVDRVVGLTPLMAACKAQSVELVHALLLDHNAATHIVTANGDTALHLLWRPWLDDGDAIASRSSSMSLRAVAERSTRVANTLAILTTLIVHGADVNASNAFGETALQSCSRCGLDACAKLLLVHGADAFARDRHDKSAVEYASEQQHNALRQLLLHYDTIERVRVREAAHHASALLLKRGRGVLSSMWSQSPETLLSRLAIDQQRAGHVRNQLVDPTGRVLVCDDSDNSDSDDTRRSQ